MRGEHEKPPPVLQRLVSMFRSAMHQLQRSPADTDLERWAVLIHASMSGRGRSYHTVEHVFDVSGNGSHRSEGHDSDGSVSDGSVSDGIGALAILFHDTVYCQVDGGLPRGLDRELADALTLEGARVELTAFEREKDPLRAMVVDIFGFAEGQPVTHSTGLNEFASALLAARSLRSHLTLTELSRVVTCIEATIPFRPLEAEEALYERLVQADRVHGLALGEAGAADALHRAVGVANQDVGNFAHDDAAAFLSYTWELLPETNPTLRVTAYTLGEYREALAWMESFMRGLSEERVFRAFRGRPADPMLGTMRKQAARNLAWGTRYLREKLLAIRVLESLALLTGGDVPVSLMMGDLPTIRPDGQRLEHLLPPARLSAADASPDVFRLLELGRARESGFDRRTSPLATFLYGRLGDAKSDEALSAQSGADLLKALPRPLLVEVADACAQIAPTRAHAIRSLVDGL